MERAALAPWLPPRRPKRCLRLRWSLGLVSSLLLLLYMLLVGLLLLICQLPALLLNLLLVPAAKYFGYIVEYAYSLRLCKLHVTIERFVQSCFSKRPYHSRCLDLRSELLLEPEGHCYVHPLPCLTANFAYLLVDASQDAIKEATDSQSGLPCCLVDPCDASAVVELVELLAEGTYAEFGGLALEAVLCTHKHWDHAGGNADMRSWAKKLSAEAAAAEASAAPRAAPLRCAADLPVYGGHDDAIPGRTHPLESGERFAVGRLELEALATPGHTAGSMAFCIRNLRREPGSGESALDAVFSGDCLFSGGCGAPFEGSNLDMEHCFASILQRCDPCRTLLFPGHEYTMMLLDMELKETHDSSLEAPPGQFLTLCGEYYTVAHRRRLHDNIPTVPCTLSGEQQVNPIFRALRRRARTLLGLLDVLLPDGANGCAEPSANEVLPRPLPPHLQGLAASGGRQQSSSAKDSGTSEEAQEAPASRPFALAGRSQEFSFVYRAELEALRDALKGGELKPAEAADMLMELERNVFKSPVLTGDDDAFDDEGATPSQEAHLEGPSAPDAGGEELEAAEHAVREMSHREFKERRSELSRALKVLGAPPEVALGRKAPCAEEQLPLSLPRLLAVMRRLGVQQESSLELLERNLQSVVAGQEPGGAQSSGSGADGLGLLPLGRALEVLCPEPPRSGLGARVASRLRGLVRCCACRPSCSCWRRAPHDRDGAEEAPPPEAAGAAQPSAREAEEAVRCERRRAAVERERLFARHDLRKCPVCRGSSAARRAALLAK